MLSLKAMLMEDTVSLKPFVEADTGKVSLLTFDDGLRCNRQRPVAIARFPAFVVCEESLCREMSALVPRTRNFEISGNVPDKNTL